MSAERDYEIRQGATWSVALTVLTGSEGLTWRDAWSGTAAYAIDDAVSYNGAYWKCVTAHTNQTPVEGVYWAAINPVNLNGATITGAIRERPGATLAGTLTCTVTDAAGGKVTITISDELTALIAASSSYAKAKTYYYDVLLERSDGVAYYILYGKMSVWGGVQIV